MAHECSFYCHGDTHALRLLAITAYTRERLLATLTAFPPPDMEVLDVFFAREADSAA